MGLDLSYSAGQTPLNEEEIDGLKITHISTQNELNEFEQLNIETALEWLLSSKPKLERVLTEKFIKQVHKKMFDQVWKWAGEFRKTDKNIGVPWHQIGFESNTSLMTPSIGSQMKPILLRKSHFGSNTDWWLSIVSRMAMEGILA